MEKLKTFLVNKFLGNKVFYLGEEYYLVDFKDKEKVVVKKCSEKELPDVKIKLIILGKNSYFETQREFPFSNYTDLKNVISIEKKSLSPYDNSRFFIRPVKIREDKTIVNIWFLKENTKPILEMLKPVFVIPESFLVQFIANSAESCNCSQAQEKPIEGNTGRNEDGRRGKLLTVLRKNNTLQVFCDEYGIISSILYSGAQINTDMFRRIIGYKAFCARVMIVDRPNEYMLNLVSALDRLDPRTFRFFLYEKPITLDKSAFRVFRRMGIGILVLTLLYFLGLTFYLNHKLTELNIRAKALESTYKSVLEIESRVTSMASLSKSLASTINDYSSRAELLRILGKILPEQTVLSSLSIHGHQVEIRGKTPETTLLIEKLTNCPRFKEVKFISSVRKSSKRSNMEVFAIRFLYF